MDAKEMYAKIVKVYDVLNEELHNIEKSYQETDSEDLKARMLSTSKIFKKLEEVRNAMEEDLFVRVPSSCR